jgi:uncharacterized protein YqjF (DUF2071 family)
MRMRWNDLLFAHWPVEPELIRRIVPRTLALDTYEGRAWLGVVPFVMEKVGARGVPDVPYLSAFPELNVRTYVTAGGRAGVWFFSLDAARAVAVAAARALFHLPYFRARMSVGRDAGRIRYVSERWHRGAPAAELDGTYAPAGDAFIATEGSLDHFLTSRYCLFSADRRGNLYRVDVHHVPWSLQPAVADLRRNSYARACGVELPAESPVLHFSRTLDVVAWMPERIVERE